MRKNFFYSTAIGCCFLFLMTIASGLDGRWTGNLTTPDGDNINVAYNFKTDGNVLSGTAESPAGEVSIDNGKVSDSTFSFEVTVQGTVYPHKGILHGDSCGVDIDFGQGATVHTTIVRDTNQ